jgi:hypothetical protein
MADEVAVVKQGGGALMQGNVTEVIAHVRLIEQVKEMVMKDGTHYGKVPGCGDKPTLLKPGAEKLLFVFGLRQETAVAIKELPAGHREYTVTTTVLSRDGVQLAQGVGICSTMESKYRYRGAKADDKVTDVAVPPAYWNRRKAQASPQELQQILAQAVGRAGRFGTKKVDETWMVTERGEETGGKVENPDIADVYNTVLKMAKKRSMVDGALTATASSDFFAQDLEELEGREEAALEREEKAGRLKKEPVKQEPPPKPRQAAGTSTESEMDQRRRVAANQGKPEPALKGSGVVKNGESLDKAFGDDPPDDETAAEFLSGGPERETEGPVDLREARGGAVRQPTPETKQRAEPGDKVSANGITFEQWSVMSDDERKANGHVTKKQINYINQLCKGLQINGPAMLEEIQKDYPEAPQLTNSWQLTKKMAMDLIDSLSAMKK